jgi:hypothetical protein
MNSLEKVAAYLDSFGPEDKNYDYVCYIREKLADIQGTQTGGIVSDNEEDENSEAKNVEIAEQDKALQNLEGNLMTGAFQDLDVLNQLQDQKEKTLNTKKASPVKDLLSRISKTK